MIRYLPQIYEEELLFSFLSRLYTHSPYTTSSTFKKSILRRETEAVDYTFYNCFNEETAELLDKKFGIENLIKKHTLVPFYSAFYSREAKNEILKKAIWLEPNISKSLAYPTEHCGYVRYCPICIKGSGEPYFTREAQIMGADFCPRHFCRYRNANLKVDKEKYISFKSLDQIDFDFSIPKMISESDINIKVSAYVSDFVRAEQNYNCDIPIGSFLTSKIENTKYVSSRGAQRNLDLLLSDMGSFYEGLEYYKINKSRLANILRNRYMNVFDILLIALFLGIKTDELLHPILPEKSQSELFDEKVNELYRGGMNISRIARETNANKEVIRQILLGAYVK